MLRLSPLLILFLTQPTFAKRIAETFPLESETISRAAEGNSRKSLGIRSEVQLVNLSGVNQNIVVRLLDESITSRMMVRNISGLSGWKLDSPGKSTSWIRDQFIPKEIRQKSVRLGPYDSMRVNMPAYCSLRLNGIHCDYTREELNCLPSEFGYQDPVAGVESCPVTHILNQECATGVNYKVRLQLEVEEDVGALLANFRIVASICNGGDALPEKINYPVNGGRPF